MSALIPTDVFNLCVFQVDCANTLFVLCFYCRGSWVTKKHTHADHSPEQTDPFDPAECLQASPLGLLADEYTVIEARCSTWQL